MSKKSQVCVACGTEKGKDDFERFDGGKVWSPTCVQCAAEQARLRERADRERQRRAAEEAERLRQARLQERLAERQRASEAEQVSVVPDPIPELPPPPQDEQAADQDGLRNVVDAVRRLERELNALNHKLQQWEFFHHPIRTIAYGLVAWSVLAGIIGLIAVVGWGLILGAGGLQTQGATAANIGLVVGLVGLGVLIGLSIWMVRLLKR